MPRPAWILCQFLSVAVGCAGGEDRVCSADADCASLMCLPDGTCAPLPGDDAGADGPDGGGGIDSGAEPGDGGLVPPADATLDRDAAIPGCAPNRDGRIERAEVPLRAGLRATVRVATYVTVDTSGEVLSDGTRRWDLTGPYDGDRDALIETMPLDDWWFAGDYPGASYAAELSVREDLLGIFEISASDLVLRGVASPDEGATRTRVTHDPPVTTLAFPLAQGDSWSTDATVSGLASGVFATWREQYESTVDARGELLTPFGTFPVLRVQIVLTRTVGFLVTVIRTFAFVSECFGTVATVTSRDDETRTDFTEAAELRRLAP